MGSAQGNHVAIIATGNVPNSYNSVTGDSFRGKRIASAIFNGGLNPSAAASLATLTLGYRFMDVPVPQPASVMTTGSQGAVSVFGSVALDHNHFNPD